MPFPGGFGRMEASHKDAIKQHLGDFWPRCFALCRQLYHRDDSDIQQLLGFACHAFTRWL